MKSAENRTPGGRAVTVSAPSNIALVKYMGKADHEANLPANASLSLTLSGLCTIAEVRDAGNEPGSEFRWVPALPEKAAESALKNSGLPAPKVPELSEAGQARILRHCQRTREAVSKIFRDFDLEIADGLFRRKTELRTANTFPSDSGIASSASSFAAVTLGVALHSAENPDRFAELWDGRVEFRRALARLARLGSGSSCRSFEGPWVAWESGEGGSAAAIDHRMPELVDFVVLVGVAPKKISSSQAHAMVETSPLWLGRTDRIAERIRVAQAALGDGDLRSLSRMAWSEMWEMHSLFHTCAQPFSYWEPGTMEVLQFLAPMVNEFSPENPPPVVTMDAGANVHVIVPQSKSGKWRNLLKSAFPRFGILEDRQGNGPRIL